MAKNAPRIIKKYANRRLYDTVESSYINQDKVKEYVVDGIHFRIVVAKTGEDITRTVLFQIILDEEVLGVPLFTEESLRSIILFSGSTLRGSFSGFLEQMLPMLQHNQSNGLSTFSGRQIQDTGSRFQDQVATLQGMMLGNTFQEYVNRNIKIVGKVNRRIAKNTVKLMKPRQSNKSKKC